MTQCGVSRVVLAVTLLGLSVGPTFGQPADQSDAMLTPAGAVAGPAKSERILSLAPGDARFIAYTSDLERSSTSPIIRHVGSIRGDLAPVLETLAEAFRGPALIAISGTLDNPLSWRVTFAAEIAVDRYELFQRLAARIVPAWNRSSIGAVAGELQFRRDGARGHLTIAGAVPFSMTLVTRNGIAFGANLPDKVDGWERGIEAKQRFVDSDEFKRLNDELSASVGSLVYLDLRSLVPKVADALNATLPQLYEALQLDVVESIALVGSEPARPRPLRVAIGVKDIRKGPWRLLASAPSGVELARVFPPDTVLLVEGAMAQASDIVEDVKAMAAVIDREITDEYEQERAEFKSETGLDPQSDILANLAGAWAFGVRGSSDGFDDPLLAVQLKSAEEFKAHVETLRSVYHMETSSMSHRGMTIERAERKAGRFSFAVVQNVLLISPEHEAVIRAIDTVLNRDGLDRSEAFNAVRERLAFPTSKRVYVNLAELFPCPPEPKDEAEAQCVTLVAEAGTAMGLAVVPHERMIALEFASSNDTIAAAIALLCRSVDESLERAKYLSAREVSTASVKGLLVACHVHASNHKGRWPESLDALVGEGLLGNPTEATSLLADPYSGESRAVGKPYYLYRVITDPASVREPSTEVVISEPAIHNGGAVFGFMDGHVEWVESPRADELLELMRSGR